VSPSRRLVLVGWLCFTASGVLYLTSAVKARDPWTIAGAAVWLVGVVAFLVALRADQ